MKNFTKDLCSKIVMLFMGTMLIVGCEPYEDSNDIPVPTEDPKIISYTLTKAANPQLTSDIVGVINDSEGTITIIIDYDVSNTKFTPTVVLSSKTEITPSASQQIDGSLTTNKYVVKANGKNKEYTMVFLINRPLSFISLKVNGTQCWLNEGDSKIYVPIDQSLWGKPCDMEVIGTGVSKIFVDGVEVVKGAKAPALSFDKEHSLKISKGTEEITKQLVVSGLPIVHLQGKYQDPSRFPEKGNKGDIEISIYDPTSNGIYTVEKLFAGIAKRGGFSASQHEKQPYSLEIRDRSTKMDVDTVLLGLRKDSDWILDAMATDNIRMRNRVATDIWNDLHKLGYAASEPKAVPATRGKMVEIYYNNEYHGLYCFTERVDRKQLNLDKTNGYLYKAEGWDKIITFSGYNAGYLPSTGSERWEDGEEGYQAEYPETFVWTPLVDFVKFVCDSNDQQLGAGIASRFDMNNLVDFFIFNNIMGSTDNCAKNTFIGVYNYASPDLASKRLFYSVWDLDGTFGRNYAMERTSPGRGIVCFPYSNYSDADNKLIIRLAKTNGGGFGDKVKARWAEVKDGVCSKAQLSDRFKRYETLLNGSGAYQREASKWDVKDLSSEVNYIDGWLSTHLTYFDNYIKNWDANVRKL
ncbi:MAG: CotH kinase family protein [Rikenellaceae bacterium]